MNKQKSSTTLLIASFVLASCAASPEVHSESQGNSESGTGDQLEALSLRVTDLEDHLKAVDERFSPLNKIPGFTSATLKVKEKNGAVAFDSRQGENCDNNPDLFCFKFPFNEMAIISFEVRGGVRECKQNTPAGKYTIQSLQLSTAKNEILPLPADVAADYPGYDAANDGLVSSPIPQVRADRLHILNFNQTMSDVYYILTLADCGGNEIQLDPRFENKGTTTQLIGSMDGK